MIHKPADASAGLTLACSCTCDEQAVDKVRQPTLAFPGTFSILRSILNSLFPAALSLRGSSSGDQAALRRISQIRSSYDLDSFSQRFDVHLDRP